MKEITNKGIKGVGMNEDVIGQTKLIIVEVSTRNRDVTTDTSDLITKSVLTKIKRALGNHQVKNICVF